MWITFSITVAPFTRSAKENVTRIYAPNCVAHSPKLSHALSLSLPESLSDFRLFPHHKPTTALPPATTTTTTTTTSTHLQFSQIFIMSTTSAEIPSSKKTKLSSDEHHRETTPENMPTTTITGATPPNATPTPNSDRKPRFQRVFSEEDEIYLLKGFLEITQDTPNPAMAAPMLYERVGKSLSGEINQTQLIEKLRKLRQKYTKQVVEKLVIKNPHEKEIFEISNKIWGENPSRGRRSSSKGPSSNKRVRKRKSSGGDVPKGGIVVGLPSSFAADGKGHVADKAYYAAEGLNGTDDDAAPASASAAKIDLANNYSFLMEELNQLPRKSFMKQGLKCLGRAELGMLDENWRLQQIEEAQLSLQRNALIHEQTKMILEAIAASKNGN
ncbi:hypothetical protein MKX01_027306 [Papaver californicum]|nr:hypothetical protein MKX01_027306 [Papaver californicum]